MMMMMMVMTMTLLTTCDAEGWHSLREHGVHVGTFYFIFPRSRSRCFVRCPLRWDAGGLLGLFSLAETSLIAGVALGRREAWIPAVLFGCPALRSRAGDMGGSYHASRALAMPAALIRRRPRASSVLPKGSFGVGMLLRCLQRSDCSVQ